MRKATPRLQHLLTIVSAAVLSLPACAIAAEAKSDLTPDAALKKLLEGNERFASGNVKHPHQGEARRAEVAKGQAPFAIVVGCSDSRTSPEVIFDQGLGDVFVTRLAGNIADDAALGSIEFGVAKLGAKVILVLGHERCGAVDAALAGAKVPGKIGTVLKPIRPAVEAVKKAGTPTLDAAIDENARLVAAGLADRSEILSDAVKAGSLKIVSGTYDLDTGRVKLVK